jgi:DNA-binding MarR family transcriptional regulator
MSRHLKIKLKWRFGVRTDSEYADGVGLSKPSVQRAIEILEARGKVKREPNRARTVLPIR